MTDSNQKPLVPNYNNDVGRLVTDRFDFQTHVNGTAFNHQADQITLNPSLSITAHGTFTDVQDILATLATLVSAPVVPNATTSTPGLIQLGGDLLGTGTTYLAPRVSGLQGIPVNTVPPSSGQILTFNGSSWGAANPLPASGGAGGDLSGVYPGPTVIKINGASVPSSGALVVGQVLQVSGASSLIYGNVSMAGDVTGNNTASVVSAIRGNIVASGTLGVSQDQYSLTWVNGSSQLQFNPSSRNLAYGWATNLNPVAPPTVFTTVTSVTITPVVTGKIRVTVTGYTNNQSSSGAVLIEIWINAFGGTSADFTQFLGVSQGTTVTNPVNIVPISYSYDYSKKPSPHIFTLGTPVTFTLFIGNGISNTVGVDVNGLQLQAQEVF